MCENETCSDHGYCKDVDHKATCQCFGMYKGEKCEFETQEKKAIKNVVSSASIIAIVIIISFYALIIISDLMNIICKIGEPKRKKSRSIEKKFYYVP